MSLPFSLLGLAPSFGFGDRTGLATIGHAKSMIQHGEGILPIFAQQSIREMTRTQRTPYAVVFSAVKGAETAGWSELQGADADHLKTFEDIELTANNGFTFFTLDPSGDVDQEADNDTEETLKEKYAKVESEIPWITAYKDQSFKLSSGLTITFDEATLLKAAVKYGKAINTTVTLARHVEKVSKELNQEFEIELSVDETEHPTTAAEHFLIMHRLNAEQIEIVSLAPRFMGDFEKGIDFKGDISAFEDSLRQHVAISDELGPYKLSLHSGSDKLSIYETFSRITGGKFHVKTAGTSYLEALRVVLRHDESLFRKIVTFSRDKYPTDKKTYHVSAENEHVPPEEEIATADELESLYLGKWSETPDGEGFSNPGRQILHCTFGSVLTHPEMGAAIHNVLVSHAKTYEEVLVEHFGRHLIELKKGLS